MASTVPPRDALTGIREQPVGFEHLDMSHRLRLRDLVGICMPMVFETLHAEVGLLSLRNRGYAPVSFYLDFAGSGGPIAVGSDLGLAYTIRLCRSVGDAQGRSSARRLMFVSHVVLEGEPRRPDPDARGPGDTGTPTISAGSAHIMHVLTRPAAAAGEHRVDTVPEELRALKEHRWDDPLPSLERLSLPPEDYERVDAGAWAGRADVWGRPNTDINQHVNVKEYVMGAENHFTRLLHGAGLPVARHRIARARLLLRKPFFPGQSYALQAALYRKHEHTRMQAGFYLMDGDGRVPRASSFLVLDGVLQGAPPPAR